MSKLILHIGAEKTGTTTIQHFCANNRVELQRNGIIYPSIGFCDHAHYSLVSMFHPLDNNGKPLEFAPTDTSDPKEGWKQVKDIFDAKPETTVLISAEHFSSRLREKGIRALFGVVKALGENVNTEIIIYVRRQDLYFESWYSTHIKAGGVLSVNKAFSMRLNQRWFYDYYFIVSKWAEFFGKENIKIVIYDDVQTNGGLIKSFLNSIGLQGTEKYNYEVKETNKAWSPRTLAIARHVNMNYREALGNKRYRFLEFVSSTSNGTNKRGVISPKDAGFLLSKYQESNKNLAYEYLGREDKIFDTPEYANFEWEDPMCFDVDDVIPLLIKAYLKCQ